MCVGQQVCARHLLMSLGLLFQQRSPSISTSSLSLGHDCFYHSIHIWVLLPHKHEHTLSSSHPPRATTLSFCSLIWWMPALPLTLLFYVLRFTLVGLLSPLHLLKCTSPRSPITFSCSAPPSGFPSEFDVLLHLPPKPECCHLSPRLLPHLHFCPLCSLLNTISRKIVKTQINSKPLFKILLFAFTARARHVRNITATKKVLCGPSPLPVVSQICFPSAPTTLPPSCF